MLLLTKMFSPSSNRADTGPESHALQDVFLQPDLCLLLQGTGRGCVCVCVCVSACVRVCACVCLSTNLRAAQ